jgi:hypothetical protein
MNSLQLPEVPASPTGEQLAAVPIAAADGAPLAHCPGWDAGPEDWLEECHDCQRRTAPAGGETMPPPPIIALWCENYVPPDPPA